jgi:hypothetical protein
MTSHTPKATPRKRLLLFTILSVAILVVAWITYFLLTFDLNNYRQQAEERLSSLLSLSVKIGEVHYSLNDTNLALRVANLQIGNKDSTVQVDAPDILINLQWRGLLERNFKFTKISLAQPHIWVRPAINVKIDEDSAQTKRTPLMIDQALLYKISIDNLKIINGVVDIEIARPGWPAQQVKLTELDGELIDIHLNQVSQFTMKGDLRLPGQKRKSPWQLQGESSLKLDDIKGLAPHFNLGLKVKDLDLSTLGAALVKQPSSYSIEGISDLHLHIEGSPTGSIDFQAGLSSNDITLKPGPAYSNPIHFKHLSANGQLEAHGDHPGINNLSLQVDESRLTGSIGWAPHGQPFSATITLLNSNLTVSQVKKWLPDNQESLQPIRQKLLEQGSIQIERAEFTLFENTRSQTQGRIDRLKGELLQIAWDLENAPAAEITSLPFDFADNLWLINNGQGKLGSHQLTVNGTGEYKEGDIVFTSLDFSSDVRPSKLLEEWHIPPPQALTTSGNIAINGHLEGPPNRLNLDLRADLSQFSISHPVGLKLTPGAQDSLTLHATLTPQKISLDHGALKWSVLKGHLSGGYLDEDPDSLVIDALLTVNDLSRLAEAFPLLETLQLHGQADLSIAQRGLPENNRPEMILTLRDAGLSATSHIADLSLINGRVQLTPTGLTADNLRVHLGESPLVVQVQLADFTNPQLVLDVRAPSIRADELIFYSDKAMLRDINGHLEIDRNGLSFAPVDVRLDGGTKASVRGTISFHPPFDVRLDITSEFASISEVVNLWADRSGTKKKRSQPGLAESAGGERAEDEPLVPVRIHAQVKRGDLYGMSFHDASGVIVPTRERLSIHPLDFSVGEGYCNAQVLTEFSPEAPTLLRISGHAEEVDALEVYRELLNQKNIVRGKLRGDFYLYGEIGPNYLPSSYGNFSIQIRDGVLHQFHTLSKVFSLLNVLQIFALQLPDMDLEGMPFDTLSANFQLDKGNIRSEDLKIQSEAMNQVYIGELNLIDKELDLKVTIHPLGTVDKVVSHIPVAGWLLTGEDKALLTARFAIEGQVGDASVTLMPLDTLTKPTIGLLRRTLELPFKLFKDPQILWGGDASDEAEE